MAQDVTLNPTDTSGGAVIHTDEISNGAHVQRIKIGIGNPGVYTDVSAANPFPVSAAQSGAWVVSDGAVVNALSGVALAANQLPDGHNVTVDNASIAVTQSGAWAVSDGAVVGKLNTVLGNTSLVTSGAIRVNLDSSNVSIGGGTQYSVGTSGVGSAGVGTLMIGVRDDALTTLASGQGQAVPLRVDSTGALWVAAAPGDAETTDGATIHSAGVTRQVNVGFVAEPNTVSVGANTIGMAAMNSQRAIHVSIREDSVGIGGGTQYSVGTSGLSSTGVGGLMIGVRDDALSTLASGEGQAIPLRVDSTGALWVNNVGTAPTAVSDGAVVSALAGTLTVSVGSSVAVTGTVTANAGSGTMAVSDGAVVARLGQKLDVSVGSTITVAGTVTADAGSGTWAVSDGAVVAALGGTLSVSDGAVAAILSSAADTTGAFLVRAGTDLESIVKYHDQTVTTGSIIVSSGFAAGGAGIYNYITDVTITNSSATNTVVQLRDGVSGAVIWTFPVPANGGVTSHFVTPLKQTTANTALAWDPLTAATTLYISLNGFQAQG